MPVLIYVILLCSIMAGMCFYGNATTADICNDHGICTFHIFAGMFGWAFVCIVVYALMRFFLLRRAGRP